MRLFSVNLTQAGTGHQKIYRILITVEAVVGPMALSSKRGALGRNGGLRENPYPSRGMPSAVSSFPLPFASWNTAMAIVLRSETGAAKLAVPFAMTALPLGREAAHSGKWAGMSDTHQRSTPLELVSPSTFTETVDTAGVLAPVKISQAPVSATHFVPKSEIECIIAFVLTVMLFVMRRGNKMLSNP